MKRVIMKKLLLILLSFVAFACTSNDSFNPQKEGEFTNEKISTEVGFFELKRNILFENEMNMTNFNMYSVEKVSALDQITRDKLKKIRLDIPAITNQTIIQKVIPLENVLDYMNNVYGGTVGGFVCNVADVKNIVTQKDIIGGLRLDYEGTLFRKDGAGYAVLRFRSNETAHLEIPFSPELGGEYQNPWPFTGNGFTSSTLGYGGFPEYTFKGYYAPIEGAELYEITPNGHEILRSIFKNNRWVTYDAAKKSVSQTQVSIRNGVYATYNNTEYELAFGKQGSIKIISNTNEIDFEYDEDSNRYYKYVSKKELKNIRNIQSFANYKDIECRVIGEKDSQYILRSNNYIPESRQAERGIFEILVDKSDISVIEK